MPVPRAPARAARSSCAPLVLRSIAVAHPLGRAVGGGGQRPSPPRSEQRHQLRAVESGRRAARRRPPRGRRRTRVRSSSTMRGWSVTAAPTSPTRAACGGISASTRSGATGAHAAVGRPPHHAVGAAARAAALRLDEEHRAQLGVRREDLRARRQPVVVGLGDRGQRSPSGPGRRSRACARARSQQRARGAARRQRIAAATWISSSASPMHDHVGEGRERHRVGEGERPAAHHQRVPRRRAPRASRGMPARSSISNRPASSSS